MSDLTPEQDKATTRLRKAAKELLLASSDFIRVVEKSNGREYNSSVAESVGIAVETLATISGLMIERAKKDGR